MYKKLSQYIESIVDNIGIVSKENKIIQLILSSTIIVLVIIISTNISLLVLVTYVVATLVLLIFQLIAVYRRRRCIAFLHFLVLPLIFILFILIIKTTFINGYFINNKIFNGNVHLHYLINEIFGIMCFISLVIINCIFICFLTRRSIINSLLEKLNSLPLRLAIIDSHLSDGLLSIEQAKQERRNIITNYNQHCLIDVFSKFLNILFMVSNFAMIIILVYYNEICNNKSLDLLSYTIYSGMLLQLVLFVYGLSLFLWNKYL